MSFTVGQAFYELLEMEKDGILNDEDASLQMMLIYWGA